MACARAACDSPHRSPGDARPGLAAVASCRLGASRDPPAPCPRRQSPNRQGRNMAPSSGWSQDAQLSCSQDSGSREAKSVDQSRCGRALHLPESSAFCASPRQRASPLNATRLCCSLVSPAAARALDRLDRSADIRLPSGWARAEVSLRSRILARLSKPFRPRTFAIRPAVPGHSTETIQQTRRPHFSCIRCARGRAGGETSAAIAGLKYRQQRQTAQSRSNRTSNAMTVNLQLRRVRPGKNQRGDTAPAFIAPNDPSAEKFGHPI